MEKISKEELLEKMKLVGVSAEDLEKIAGGGWVPEKYSNCVSGCVMMGLGTMESCRETCNIFLED